MKTEMKSNKTRTRSSWLLRGLAVLLLCSVTFVSTTAVTAIDDSAKAQTTFGADVYMCSGKPWIDVRCNGALGDDSHDDTTALRNTIAQAELGPYPIYMSPGTYKVTSGLTIDTTGLPVSGLRIISANATIDGTTVASGPVIQIQRSGGTTGSPALDQNTTIEGTLNVLGDNASYSVIVGKADYSDEFKGLYAEHLVVTNSSSAAGAGAIKVNYAVAAKMWMGGNTSGGSSSTGAVALEQVQDSSVSGYGSAAGASAPSLLIEGGTTTGNTVAGFNYGSTSNTCLSVTSSNATGNSFVAPSFGCTTAVNGPNTTGNILIPPVFGGTNRGPISGAFSIVGRGSLNRYTAPAASSYTALCSDDGTMMSSSAATGAPAGWASSSLPVTLPNASTCGVGWSMGFVTDANKAIVVTTSSSQHILSSGLSLTSMTLGPANYEVLVLKSDGSNWRIEYESQGTANYNGVSCPGYPSRYQFVAGPGYGASQGDNGSIISSALVSGTLSITLPSTTAINPCWTIGITPDGSNPVTVTVNGTSGGKIEMPGGLLQSTATLVANNAPAIVQFDGANFRVVGPVPGLPQALDVRQFGALTTNGNNTSYFSAADAAATALGGATIYVPVGTWNLSSVPTMSQQNQWILQPGALLSGAGALGAMTYAQGSILMGPSTFNPYAYDTYAGVSPLQQNALYIPQGSITVNNPVPHGILTEGGSFVAAVGGNVDNINDVGECYLGISSYSQIAQFWDAEGGVAVCEIFNANPPLNKQGTFTSTSFIPSVPFPLSDLPGGLPLKDVRIITDDNPLPYVGMSSSTTLNGSGLVTAINVPGWYLSGASSTSTPTGHTAFINFGGNQFVRNSKSLLVQLNGMSVSTISGSPNITLSGTDLSLVSRYQFIGDGGSGIPTNAVITDVNSVTGAAVIDPPAIATISTHGAIIAARPFNLGQVAEEDVRNHSGFDFDPTVFPETVTVSSGSNQVTAVSDIADLRIGMNCSGGIPTSLIVGIDRGSSAYYLDNPSASSGTFSGYCYWGYQQNNAGIVISSQNNISEAGFNARGENAFGFLSQGANDTAFLIGRQTGSDARPLWGFRSDRTFSGPSVCDFALTNLEKSSMDGNTTWCLNPFQEVYNRSGVTLPSAPTTSFIMQLAGVTGTIVNPYAWGQGAYFEPSAAGGTPSAPTALTSGAAIGGIQFSGYDGSAWSYNAGVIQGAAGGNWSSSSHPTDVQILNVPSGSTAAVTRWGFEQDGTLISFRMISGPTATAGPTACGTSPSVTGTPMTGTLNMGSGTVGTSCPIAWPSSTEQIPHCNANDRNTNALMRITSATLSGITISGSYAAGDTIDYQCSYTN